MYVHAKHSQYFRALRKKHALQLPPTKSVGTAIKLCLNQFFGYLYFAFIAMIFAFQFNQNPSINKSEVNMVAGV